MWDSLETTDTPKLIAKPPHRARTSDESAFGVVIDS